MSDKSEHWAEYNAHQAKRTTPRPLLRVAQAKAGPGARRTAIDVGAGAGVETLALLGAGWRVHALDSDAGALSSLVSRVPDALRKNLTTASADLRTLPPLPTASLIYSGYTLSWLPPGDFERLWDHLRAVLKPGAVLAVNIFGDRDSWAGRDDLTCLSEARIRDLFHGLDILHWDVEDADGQAWSGPKHWHVVDVVAQVPAPRS